MAQSRVDRTPGRRRAEPTPPARRRATPARPGRAHKRADRAATTRRTGQYLETPEALPPPELTPVRRWSVPVVVGGWLPLAVAGTAAVVTARTALPVPSWLPTSGAVTMTGVLAFGLSARAGGRPQLAGTLALVLAAAAVLSDEPRLVAAASVSTAVLGAVLGVMITTPAARVRSVVTECLVATLVGVVTALAVAGYEAQVSLVRAQYVVLGLALAGALALAHRLAAGLHGLGRRGAVMLVTGLALLVVSLAYTAALSRWASPDLVDGAGRGAGDLRDAIGAVPRPTEFLLGVPALAWGVSSRARRRQGWWGTGFGAAGLATVATTLLDRTLPLAEAALSTAYSLLLGLLLGYLLIRLDTLLSGARGSRARRLEEASAHRPEPGRFRPLL